MYFQVSGDTLRKTELTLISSVKSTRESISEPMTVYARFEEPPDIEPPIIIGSNSRIHGASTVRIPATKEMVTKRSMK